MYSNVPEQSNGLGLRSSGLSFVGANPTVANASIAQLGERVTVNHKVDRSKLSGSVWSYSLMVMTPVFETGDLGSIPNRTLKCSIIVWNVLTAILVL